MRRIFPILAAAMAFAIAGCSSSSDSGGGTPYNGFAQPANTAVVNFVVDDSVNRDWKAGELEWKGQLQFDPATRIGTFNSDWNAEAPGWAKLYDDGPWDQLNTTTNAPGHEPKGSVAGDHKWGVTAFVLKPATNDIVVNYGLRDATNADRANGGWVWIGSPGSFTVTPTSTEVSAPGMAFPAKGAVDLKLVIDKNGIAVTDPPFDTSTIKVKGSAWGWAEKDCYDDGTHGDDTANDGLYTFVLSINIDGTVPPYPGLLKSGDKPEFVYMVGGVEYKVGGDASPTGVTAFYKPGAGSWTSVAVTMTPPGAFGANTMVTIP